MVLIADSGSTKTSWVLTNEATGSRLTCKTQGINPFYQAADEIYKTLESEFVLEKENITRIAFYGAGCANPQKNSIVEEALKTYFETEKISVYSDLLGAARSLCQRSEGIAAILGTGSNSCLFDGKKIVSNVSPLGFILGDEGSGAVLGRKLLSDVLKNQLPQRIIDNFMEMFGQTAPQLMENVYRKPFPNRYLASLTVFLSKHINEDPLFDLVKSSFIEFFERNIKQYHDSGIQEVHFSGSIAWHFREILQYAAHECGYELGKVIKDPMEGLLQYHESDLS